jgi:galactose mutarotase-like enzyme
MPFSIGNHLTLRMPLPDGSDFETSLLRGPARRLYTVEPPGFEGAGSDILLEEGVPLNTSFCANALLGGFTGPEAEMYVQAKSFCVRAAQRVLTPEVYGTGPEEFRFVLYEDGTRRFFCLEPWLGRPNSLNTGQGVILLAPGQAFCWEMSIQCEDLTRFAGLANPPRVR